MTNHDRHAQCLAHYLAGYLQQDGKGLELICASREAWRVSAAAELERRRMRLIGSLDDELLIAIAEGHVDVADVAEEVAKASSL